MYLILRTRLNLLGKRHNFFLWPRELGDHKGILLGRGMLWIFLALSIARSPDLVEGVRPHIFNYLVMGLFGGRTSVGLEGKGDFRLNAST
jgi:hypothetical protein